MMIGRTRLAVGPVRDLGQLAATTARIRTIPGVERVDVEAFVGRRVLLAAHVLHPVDLAGELRVALRGDLASCVIGADRVEVVLRDEEEGPGEVVDGILEDVASAPSPGPTAPPQAAPGLDRPWSDAAGSPWEDGASAPAAPGTALVDPWSAAGVASAGRETARADAVPAIPAPAAPAGVGPGRAAPEPGDLLELSFAHAPVAKALVSPDGRWLRVNLRLCELLDRDEAALLRSSLQELTHPDDFGTDAALLRGLLAGDRDRYAVPKRYLAADGRVVPARLEVSAVRSAGGAVRWLVLEILDLAGGARDRPRLAAGARAA